MKTKYQIKVSDRFLHYEGNAFEALRIVESLREAYQESGNDMPNSLGDFVFSMEVALQDIGFLDEHFNETNE